MNRRREIHVGNGVDYTLNICACTLILSKIVKMWENSNELNKFDKFYYCSETHNLVVNNLWGKKSIKLKCMLGRVSQKVKVCK